MTDPHLAYRQSFAAYSAATARLQDLRARLSHVLDRLKTERPIGRVFTTPIATNAQRITTGDAEGWPSAQDIADCAAAVDATREAMLAAFDAIPSNDRATVVSPPGRR